MTAPLVKDVRWTRQAFLVKADELEESDQAARFFTSAALRYHDTTPGGNIVINPPPQFTRTADVKVKGMFAPGKGMGRYYSEAINDNNQVIHMRFGVPEFNSLTTFFTGFYNADAGRLARTGRADGVLYSLGKAAGMVVTIIAWPLLAVHALGVAVRFLAQKPSSKFYYLKPTMPLYWNAVTTMANQLLVNKGIVPRIGMESSATLSDGGFDDEEAATILHRLLPDIFQENGQVDVYALATKGQRLARQYYRKLGETFNGRTWDGVVNAARGVFQDGLANERAPTLQAYLNLWNTSSKGQVPDANSPDQGSEAVSKEQESDPGFWNFLEAEFDDGGAFVSFRVNSTGSVSESFSNSVGESEIANTINNMSSSSRNTNFSTANGNISEMIAPILNGAKNFLAGAADSLGISGIAALGGAAFVDIPKHWQSSSANLPRSTYTINLVSPYGNPISKFINIDLPLIMLLAGALPLSTGKHSYTSPFILELYDQGRCQTRLGIIDSLNITRGTGNFGFNSDGKAMAVEVSFSVIDLSSVMHMPISAGFSLTKTATAAVAGAVGGAAGGVIAGTAGAAAGAASAAGAALGIFDDDTVFSDYMAVLAGMSLPDQIYSWNKLKLNLTRELANFDSFYSMSHFASWLGNTPPARLVSAFYRGVDR